MRHLDRERFGPWAVVTGLRPALARLLRARSLVARRGDALERLAAELRREHGVDCRPVALDLAESTFIDSLRKTTDELDVGLVVSNAGTATAIEFVQWDALELDRDVAVNTTAHLKLAHHFGGRLASRGRGGILFVSSIAGRQPIPYLASYTAAKSFVTILGESLHAELRQRGITVTVLIAGPPDTRCVPRWASAARDFGPCHPSIVPPSASTRLPGGRRRTFLAAEFGSCSRSHATPHLSLQARSHRVDSTD